MIPGDDIPDWLFALVHALPVFIIFATFAAVLLFRRRGR
jgi:hypothetical protein